MNTRILLVENDLNTRTALSELLEMEGVAVDACENGEHALHRLKEQEYSALVTELNMPALGGDELLREARALQPAIRCIIVTAVEPPAQLHDAKAWLQKPIDFEQLLTLLLQ